MTRSISAESSIILDFFRGISAQLVLIGHLLSFFGLQSKYNIPIIQNFGVLVFFILSGFLITQTTFLKERSYGLKNYFIDRVSRIYFSFIPALILIFIIDYFIQLNGNYNLGYINHAKNFVANILQLQGYPYLNIFGIEAFGSGRPLWTVSIEFWLYITFGYIYYIISSKQKASPFQTLFFAISLPLTFYYVLGRGGGLTIYWFLGFLLTALYNKIFFKVKSVNFYLVIIILILALVYRILSFPKIYDVGIAILFSSVLFMFFNIPDSFKDIVLSKYFSNFCKFLASFSYSLYLVHYSLIELFLSIGFDLTVLNFISLFIIINILSYMFYLLFEKNNVMFRKFLKRKLS